MALAAEFWYRAWGHTPTPEPSREVLRGSYHRPDGGGLMAAA